MPGGPLLAAYVLERTTDVDEDQRLLLEDEKAEEERKIRDIFVPRVSFCSIITIVGIRHNFII